MKSIFYLFLFLVSFFCKENLSYSNISNLTPGELIVYNYSSNDLKVEVIPIGFIFNGDFKYDIYSLTTNSTYIIGGVKSNISNNNSFSLDHDAANGVGADSAIGFGKYKVIFYEYLNEVYVMKNFCYVDYSDRDYPYVSLPQFTRDIGIRYYSENDIRIWGDFSIPLNKTIEIWDQRLRDSLAYKLPNKNGFLTSLNFTQYPVNAAFFGAVLHLDPGAININMLIDNNISTRDTLIDTITNITIKKKAALFISESKTFDMITLAFGYNNLIVEDSSALVLFNSAKIILHSPNKITLKNNSRLTFHPNSELIIQPGAVICNEGANINSPGKIVFEKGVHTLCSDIVNDFFVKDSAKIILEDSAVVILPNNYNLHLRGNTTSLIMKPGLKMMFGENSGIVCDSRAKVIANSAEIGVESDFKNSYKS